MNKKYVVFTMDVESFTDTECVANSLQKIDVDLLDGFDKYMNILDKHGIKSTLFTVGSLAPKIADRLKNSIKNGHRLALHNYEHIAPMNISLNTFKNEILKAKNKLSEMFKTDVIGFRAPFFSLDDDRLSILRELGFKYDSSYLDFKKARHTVDFHLNEFKQHSNNIFYADDFFEFGISKQKILGIPFPISGGGYVRLNNWLFVKSLIQQHLKENDYYVFYLHPFELTAQKIPHIKDLKAYDKYYLRHGVSSYGKHIEELISMLKKLNYQFVTFEELTEILKCETI